MKRGRRRRQFNHDSQKWITVGETRLFQRSSWEGNFARVLEWHRSTETPFREWKILSWRHEPRTFYFDPERALEVKRLFGRTLKGHRKGVTTYKPDFGVEVQSIHEQVAGMLFPDMPEETIVIEVKGYMAREDLTRIKRFRQYYPELTLIVIDAQWFQMNARSYRSIIPDWEIMTV